MSTCPSRYLSLSYDTTTLPSVSKCKNGKQKGKREQITQHNVFSLHKHFTNLLQFCCFILGERKRKVKKEGELLTCTTEWVFHSLSIYGREQDFLDHLEANCSLEFGLGSLCFWPTRSLKNSLSNLGIKSLIGTTARPLPVLGYDCFLFVSCTIKQRVKIVEKNT